MNAHLDLFSGIGGFALAARRAGWKTIGFCETDEYCQRVLNKNFPGIPIHGDIKTMPGVPCDLITGGFPCQPYSLAGKRGGAIDDRAIWPEMLRVICESKPRWVLGENVPGIINMELDRVLSDLEVIGYSAWPIVIPACAVDARHRRSRVWVVAYRARIQQRREEQRAERERTWKSGQSIALADADKIGRTEGPVNSHEQPSVRNKFEGSGETLANSISSGLEERQEQPAWEEFPTAQRGCSSSKTNSQPQGRSSEPRSKCCQWEPEPQLGRVANGIPRRVDRLKGLGNAIVPQVAEIILREMLRNDYRPSENAAQADGQDA